MNKHKIFMQGHFADAFGSTWEADEVFDAKTVSSPIKGPCVACVEHNERHPYEYMHEKATPGHPVMDLSTSIFTFDPADMLDMSERRAQHILQERQWRFFKRTKASRVAIVVPYRSHTIDQIVLGFIDTNLKGGDHVIFDIYNAEGNSTFLFHHIVPELNRHDYDAVYTAGNQCTFLVSRFFSYQPRKIPHIFVGVSELTQFGFDLRTQGHVTGVRANDNLALQVASLLALKPDLKRAGILFNPNECGGVTAHIQKEVVRIFQDYSVATDSVSITRAEQIYEAAQSLVQSTEILLTLRDNMTLQAAGVISGICDAYGTPLYVSDLSGVSRGAALSCGYLAYPTGVLAGEKAVAILRDGMSVYDMSISETAEHFKFVVNGDARYKQGLRLDQDKLVMLEHGSLR